MSKEKDRTTQTIRFLKWIKKYNGLWQLICEPGNEHMNIQMMQKIIKRLAKEEFYEIIFTLLEIHKNENFLKSTEDGLLKDLIILEWKSGNKNEIINKLVEYLE